MNLYEKRFYEDIHKLVLIQKDILKDLKKMNEPLQIDKELKEEPIFTFENTGLAVTVYNQAKLNLLNEIKKLYEEMNNRECGDSYFTKWDGTKVSIDTGYAFGGIELFIEELEHKLKDIEEKESE